MKPCSPPPCGEGPGEGVSVVAAAGARLGVVLVVERVLLPLAPQLHLLLVRLRAVGVLVLVAGARGGAHLARPLPLALRLARRLALLLGAPFHVLAAHRVPP